MYTYEKMPASTLAAPDGFSNQTFVSTNNRRPHTARSGRSAGARSPSPLFRWTRKNTHEQDKLESGDFRSSMDSRAIISSATSKGVPHHQLTHTYNISTSTTSSKRQSQSGLPPPLSREEFEALPVAIQRKYFSTLERLRFAQASDIDDISQHYDRISAHNFKRRKATQYRSVSDNPHRPRRRSLFESHFSSADSLAFASLPDKIKQQHFTREQQSILARQLRTSVILDTADEAVYKVRRRASRQLLNSSPSTELDPNCGTATPSLTSARNSMDSGDVGQQDVDIKMETSQPSVPETFFDSFRWMDDKEDLDLRLFLDDYHASLNLRENVPVPSKQRRPSFRRHMSVSKIPFGRSSLSIGRSVTRDVTSSTKSPPTQGPTSPKSPTSDFHFGHTRRKSRALSLITPKHTAHDSITMIDPSAAHYQDPEARLKLRVYLASSQKFDEAIEFGFPSSDLPAISQNAMKVTKRQSRQHLAEDSNLRTFLVDHDDDDGDQLSLNSDQPSLADPESPQTPQTQHNQSPFLRASSELILTHKSKPSDGGYTQQPASSREMTLRMTLTRPDLRAQDEQIYGWQQGGRVQTGRKLQQFSHLRDDSAGDLSYLPDVSAKNSSKESMEKVFAGIDHWNAHNAPDGNVMKRFWNRVRRS